VGIGVFFIRVFFIRVFDCTFPTTGLDVWIGPLIKPLDYTHAATEDPAGLPYNWIGRLDWAID
jgi:hypothetical protein